VAGRRLEEDSDGAQAFDICGEAWKMSAESVAETQAAIVGIGQTDILFEWQRGLENKYPETRFCFVNEGPPTTSAIETIATPASMMTQAPGSSSEEYYVKGAVTMEVEDPETACADDALLSAFEATTAGLAGGKHEDVEVKCSVVPRRLSSGSRRLAGSINLFYRIKMPSQAVADRIVSAIVAMPAETFTHLININLPQDHTYAVTVTVLAHPTAAPVGEDGDETWVAQEKPGESINSDDASVAVPTGFAVLLSSVATFLTVG